MTLDCPLIEVSGPPFQRGVEYGMKAKGRIALGIAHYTEQLRESGYGANDLCAVVKKLLPIITAFDTQLVDEMRGIALGADVSFEEIVLLNARTEILQLAALGARRTPTDTVPDGCTGLVVLPFATSVRAD